MLKTNQQYFYLSNLETLAINGIIINPPTFIYQQCLLSSEFLLWFLSKLQEY